MLGTRSCSIAPVKKGPALPWPFGAQVVPGAVAAAPACAVCEAARVLLEQLAADDAVHEPLHLLRGRHQEAPAG